ncbi:MAG: hypothetical protein AAF378_04695 [Cyanobacteria bacterium P01_A01_bin.84]
MSSDQPEPDFEEELRSLEEEFTALKERYNQVQKDKSLQAELQQRCQEVSNNQSPGMKTELKHLKEQLETLEINLESQLFSWNSLKKPFWQAIRFGGLGVIIGWILKSYAG